MGRAKLSLFALLGKIEKKWGKRYTYISGFVDIDTPFKMSCALHGEFEVNYQAFLKAGYGCKSCNGKFIIDIDVYRAELKDQLDKHQLTLDSIKSSTASSTNTLNYTRVILNMTHTVCNKEFHRAISAVRANSFAGCPHCPRVKKPSVKCTASFIEKAQELNKRDYDYSNARYRGAHLDITLFCNTHQVEFTTTPHTVYAGGGCVKCGDDERRAKLVLKSKTLAEKKKVPNV